MRIGRTAGARMVGATLLAAVVLALGVGAVAAASTATVNIREVNNRYQFNPAKTFVNVGGTVTWSNGTDAPHTVTSDSGSSLASSTIAPNATFSHTFATAGTFAYHCTIHPYMTGTVVVLAASATPPGTDTAPTAPAQPGPPFGLLVGLAVAAAAGAGAFLLRVRAAR